MNYEEGTYYLSNYSFGSNIGALFVDDEIDLIETLIDNLGYLGIDDLYYSTNVEEALEVVQQKKIGLIFCDLCMPKTNGINLYNKLKEKGLLRRFVFVTGAAVEDIPQEIAEEVEIISKPCNYNDLSTQTKAYRKAMQVA